MIVGNVVKDDTHGVEVENLVKGDVLVLDFLPTTIYRFDARFEGIMVAGVVKHLPHRLDEAFLETLSHKKSVKAVARYCDDFYEYGAKTAYRRLKNYPGVVLTTAHSSKGLEWPIVINTVTKYDTPEVHAFGVSGIEERRRLLFVSATRAKDELIITGLYTAYGKRGDYKYNRYLIDALDCIGEKLDVTAVEAERKERKKAKPTAAERIAQLRDAAS